MRDKASARALHRGQPSACLTVCRRASDGTADGKKEAPPALTRGLACRCSDETSSESERAVPPPAGGSGQGAVVEFVGLEFGRNSVNAGASPSNLRSGGAGSFVCGSSVLAFDVRPRTGTC